MDLIIKNHIIRSPIITILNKIKSELKNGKLKDIVDKRENVLVTCPKHSDGKEFKPACQIWSLNTSELEYGHAHCFACGYSASLPQFVADCFDEDYEFGEEWLLERFGDTIIESIDYLPELIDDMQKEYYLDPSILDKFAFYHPYMFQRKLTKEIILKFHIGYNKERETITFPVWDIKNNLVMITERSVNTKNFFIPKYIDKPVYLLNYIIAEHIKNVYVCESQINALTLWSWGYPAIALLGTGSGEQYEILSKSGIRQYILCFDGDEAGDKGCKRFIKNISDAFTSIKKIPRGKDVNDLSKEEFDSLQLE